MRALRFHAARDLRIEDIAPPPPPPPGYVIAEPLLCGICGTDLHEYTDGPIVTFPTPHPFSGAKMPQILGHEFSAVVRAVGEDVSNLRPGQRVSVQPQIAPPDDYYARRGLVPLSEKVACVGLSWNWGGLAELALLPANILYPVPEAVKDSEAALVEPAAVAVHAVDRAALRPGDTLLLTGAGPIGALVLLAARAAGVARIVVSEPNGERRAFAKTLVPEAIVVDPAAQDVPALAKAVSLEGVGVDAAIECGGAGPALIACMQSVRCQGRVVQVGLHTRPVTIDPMLLTQRDISLLGCYCYPVQIWPRVLGMIDSGVLPVRKIVTSTVGLEDAVKGGFESLLDPAGNQMKVLVRISANADAPRMIS